MSAIQDVYQQFVDYFGEDKVDLQNSTGDDAILYPSYTSRNSYNKVILVHWPTVTVSNEYDESVDIWDLVAATIISPTGKFVAGPFFNRTTYDTKQWESDYLHSHVNSIRKSDIKRFKESCLGQGPINNTISKLKVNFDTDLWKLYCWELDKYVHVESIIGIPYNKLRNIGVNKGVSSNTFKPAPSIPEIFVGSGNQSKIVELINTIVSYIIDNKVLDFSYSEGRYILAMPYTKAVLDISNSFIDLYNSSVVLQTIISKELLYSKRIVSEKIIINDKIYEANDDGANDCALESRCGEDMFIFKGKMLKLQSKDFNHVYSSGKLLLLDLRLVDYIVFTILKYINLYYNGNSQIKISKETRVF